MYYITVMHLLCVAVFFMPKKKGDKSMKLVLAEKPSVAQSIAKVLGANERCDGYLEGNGYVVSWCVGHLVELFEPEGYDERYSCFLSSTFP